MFEEWRKRLAKRETDDNDEITFKGDSEDASEATATMSEAPAVRVISEDAKSDNMELKVLRPETYEEVSTVADALLAGCTVFLNLEALDRPTTVKMLDFLNGVTYCTDGEIKMVAKTTFVITPHTGVDISDM